jgi:hypothetical protein
MACGALSQDLVLPCNPSVGGVFSFYVTEYANINTLTISGGTATTFTLKTGTKFWLIPQKKQVGTFTQTYTPNIPNGSAFYNQQADFSFPRLSANVQGVLAQMAINDVIIIVKDNNGNLWLLGSNNGLTMSAGTAVSGKAYGDLNGFTVTIGDGGETYPMVQIPSSLIATLTAPAA